MKKFGIVTGVILVVLAGLGYVYRDQLGYWVAQQALTPTTAFDAAAAPPAPDYTNPETWSALPDTDDGADTTPGDAVDNQHTAQVDVFFVHPTTYLSADAWNATLDDPDAKALIDNSVNVAQASAFNGCCALYAPRYRQATFASFFPTEQAQAGGEKSNGSQAKALAYSDIDRAFTQFLERYSQGRPFILAGHSQGSEHLRRLLAERISGTQLHGRLVAVYAVGAIFEKAQITEEFNDVPVCTTATQTGCLVTWNTVGPKVAQFRDASNDVCVNPLTWGAASATHQDNPGAFARQSGQLLPGVADAACRDGQLWVSEIRSDAFANLPMNMGTDNYHILDYSLFYTSIRSNAIDRVAAYLGAR